jgi:hypothetical protein
MLENGVLANLRFLLRKLVTIFGMPHYFIKHPQKYYQPILVTKVIVN